MSSSSSSSQQQDVAMQATNALPNPLPLSPNASSNSMHCSLPALPTGGNVDAASGPYGQRSGLLTPGTGSAAVSPSITPYRPSGAPHMRAPPPPPLTMQQQPQQQPQLQHHQHGQFPPSMYEYRSAPDTSLPPSQAASPECPTFSSASELHAASAASNMSGSLSATVLPPLSSLTLGNVTPAAGTPTTRRSPTGPASHTMQQAQNMSLPSLTAAANAALGSSNQLPGGYALPRVLANQYAMANSSGSGSGAVSASAPVTRCPSPRAHGSRGHMSGSESTDDSFGDTMQHALRNRHVHSPLSDGISTTSMHEAFFAQQRAGGNPSTGEPAVAYRQGMMSMPGSPTQRHGADRRHHHHQPHRQHEAAGYGQPYDLSMRKRPRTRQNSIEDARALGGLALDGALPLTPSHTLGVGPGGQRPHAHEMAMQGHTMIATASTGMFPHPVPVSATSSTASNASIASSSSAVVGLGLEGPPGSPGSVAALDRLRRRRENHNHVERRRRDHINGTIRSLAALLPDRGRGADGQRRNKGSILESAVDWLREVQRENALLREENIMLRERCGLAAPGTAAAYAVQRQQQQQQQQQHPHPHQAQHVQLAHHHQAQPAHGMPMPVGLAERAVSAPDPRTVGMDHRHAHHHHHHHHQAGVAVAHPHMQQQPQQPQQPQHPAVPAQNAPAVGAAPAPTHQLPPLTTLFSEQ
ncbi:hypothetical protein THASP1DRAFT_33330 [Thamnocephalis sphaerospora]|uniref:BHLH domain-containing protein n=1 Tax=Thamnocephalis sphaerospora TaxID=78915 RepID=A0A4P9XGX5_9FUNG|nr:hypothetical protein THASP1DRAFT_33330 [Thamnocephalis sphaerospora]|eukprot:RKP04858.1 hypothetical protein THASP1DRAFT_33330 [Thamnocephalis sphaerospora]